ncbi:YdeI/OmpD-associated family protein [Jannaschia pagri]|nr:YdeI/OmpD-associated family protein [Jannaschia sp. AI_62]
MDRIEVTSEAALWAWLGAHHGRADGVLLVTWKATHRDKYLSRDAVLDALIAHGWIDGRRYKLDADRTMQLISPRREQTWAKTYKDRAARLEAEGRMHPAGRAAVAAGKASGLWDAMADVDALQVPDDLRAALGSGAGWFDGAAPSYRRNVLRWIAQAKTAPTRTKRIDTVAAHAQRGEKVPHY